MNLIRNACRGVALALLVAVLPAAAQEEQPEVRMSIEPVADGLEMLVGRGGNIALTHGRRVFVVDNQYAEHSNKVRAAIRTVVNREPDFIVNTHWHWDHTGGNEAFGKRGAIIFAHENVRERMSTEQFIEFFDARVEPSPAAALPVITFTRDMSFHVNGEKITVEHAPGAHTDGDAIVWWRDANAVHTGDTFFNGIYPFIDYDSGGSISGMIVAVNGMLEKMNADTKIIPGHGPLASRSDLESYRDMLVGIARNVRTAVADGKSLEEVVAMKPTADFDAEFGDGFIPPDRFVGMIYRGMTKFGGK